MPFSTIHTLAGLQAMYTADDSGGAVDLTHMAVGDGGGAEVTPDEAQTDLVNEVYRAAINRVYRPDPTGAPTRFAAELVVPATEGGFVMREVGVFDADGALFAVGNLPETYKPETSEGSFSDTVVRVEFQTTNTDTVTIQFDPNVAAATQQWVVTNVTAATLIPGGTTQQVLTKVSNADGDYVWSDPTEANIVVNTIEEEQTLSTGQTDVTLATVTTFGLAVYVAGERLAQGSDLNDWQPDGADETKLTLGQSYPDGTEIILVQNEPAASFPAALLRDQNLADVPDKPLARANLGVPSLSDLQNAVPAGAVMHFARTSAPTGWLKADGREVDRAQYSGLFSAIGTLFGDGNGVDTFNLPDLRGEFLRGHDQGRGIDEGRQLGTAQGHRMQQHYHGTGSFSSTGNDDWYALLRGWVGSRLGRLITGDLDRRTTSVRQGGDEQYIHTGTTDQEVISGSETRPRNVALLACIKA